MQLSRFATVLIVTAGTVTTPVSLQAAFHLWTFSEFFSNADGSVQFIEIVSSGSSETVSDGAQIRTDSGSTFTIVGNLAGNTLNKRLLFATPGFASLPGAVTPDYTLPGDNFFDPTGDRVRLFSPLFGEFHMRTFDSVPTDGVLSLNYPGAAESNNSPQNYAGAVGQLDLAPPVPTGDYNGNLEVDAADFVLWRDTFDQAASPAGSGADGNANGMIDSGDYDFWLARFGNTVSGSASNAAASLVPEPISPALVTLALSVLAFRRRDNAF